MKTMQAYKRAAALENSTWYKGLLISQLAGNSDTDGAFDLVESQKKGTEHLRTSMSVKMSSSTFWKARGTYLRTQVFSVGAGESVFLPKRVPHAYLTIPTAGIHTMFSAEEIQTVDQLAKQVKPRLPCRSKVCPGCYS